MKTSLSKSLLTTLVILGIAGSLGLGIKIGESVEHTRNNEQGGAKLLVSGKDGGVVDMTPFWKAFEILDERFVPATATTTLPDSSKKVYGAIEGLTSAYGDPHTVFFPPKESKQFEDEVRGDFGGIGAEIALREKILTVVAPLKGTPAERVGLKAGDLILKIDDKTTDGMSVEDAVSHIRGPKGTKVRLTVKQKDEIKELSVERDTINIPTIDTKMRDDGVFVISLFSFSANSPTLFRDALRDFVLSGSDKLVLDLRNNPGGYLEAAIDMASWFLPIGKTVVKEDFGGKEKQNVHRSKGYNVFSGNLKMVVLMNEGSASASEILAGALQDHGIAKIVGTKSYGKGSVQELISVTPETSIKVTIAHWLTPSGKSISGNGLTPDVVIDFTEKDIKEKRDVQMEKAAQMLILDGKQKVDTKTNTISFY